MATTQKIKRVMMDTYGDPDVLKIEEIEIPQPAAGEVLIKVQAIGVNYADLLRRRNRYFMPTPLPYTPGSEVVGVITAFGKGSDIPGLATGTRVLAILPNGGGYAEYVTAYAQYCVPLPPQIPDAEATAIFVQGSTAHLLLHRVAQDIKGKAVLIHAASGGVGSILVQLARLAGASKIIGTAGSPGKLQAILDNGADAAVDYSEKGWVKEVTASNGGEKVDLILEMVGGQIYTDSFECLKRWGTMIVYGAASGEQGFQNSERFVDEAHRLLSFNLAYYIQDRTNEWQQSLGAVIGLMAEGKLKISVDNTYALTDAVKAHKEIENRKTKGKVVLIP